MIYHVYASTDATCHIDERDAFSELYLVKRTHPIPLASFCLVTRTNDIPLASCCLVTRTDAIPLAIFCLVTLTNAIPLASFRLVTQTHVVPLASFDYRQGRRLVRNDDVYENLDQEKYVLEHKPGQKLVLRAPCDPQTIQ